MARRRIICLGVLALLGGAIWWWRQRAHASTSAITTVPIERAPAPATVAAPPAWVPPVDGNCPDGYPVKVNETSGIFHVPGGRFYARTLPDRCYAAPFAAEADGYRRAKA